MKTLLRVITGTLLLLVGAVFALIATSLWLQGAVHTGFGAFFGTLAFSTAGVMVIGEKTWRSIAELLVD
ncbi:MAG TPA: hypothetical protein VIQ80_01390 [Candidatus Saccharimonadales bacterium]